MPQFPFLLLICSANVFFWDCSQVSFNPGQKRFRTTGIRSGGSWRDGEKMKVTNFIFLGSKITMDGDCSHEIKRCLLLRRKAMTNLNSILKSRDITLPTKVCLIKAMVYPVVMYGCESWTIKKAEHQRIDAFECGVGEDSWESLGLQGDQPVNPKGNQLWIFIGRTPTLWPPDATSWFIGKDTDAGKDWKQKEKRVAKDGIVIGLLNSMDMNLSKLR